MNPHIFHKGDRVKDADGEPGTVKAHDQDTATIQFDDGEVFVVDQYDSNYTVTIKARRNRFAQPDLQEGVL